MDIAVLGGKVQEYLRGSGYTQKDLASALSLHPKVLSRKLHGNEDAHLTHVEVRRIISTLASWQVITTQDEAHQLLALAQMQPTSFSIDEWQSPPLSQLVAKKSVQPRPFSDSMPEKPTRRHNLPAPVTRLIGREWAVERLRRLLGRHEKRPVTLLGPGGRGKTRLTIQAAVGITNWVGQGLLYVRFNRAGEPSPVPL